MRKDESRLIKTLANESEKISTKEDFFNLSNIKDHQDLNVSAWNDNKNLTLSTFSALPPIQFNSGNFRQTQNESFNRIKFDRSPDSKIRLKLIHDRSKSISLTRASVYKTSIISISESPTKKFSSHSEEHKPRIPQIRKNAIISMYLPKKRRKRMQVKPNFATIDDLMSMLQPTLTNCITKKVMTVLKSKADLTRILSKKQFTRVSHNLSIS